MARIGPPEHRLQFACPPGDGWDEVLLVSRHPRAPRTRGNVLSDLYGADDAKDYDGTILVTKGGRTTQSVRVGVGTNLRIMTESESLAISASTSSKPSFL